MKPKGILLKTLYDHRLATFFWFIGAFLTLIMYVSLFPSISQTDEFAKAMASLPDSFQSLFGDLTTVNTPEGYLQAELFSSVLPLIFAIVGITLGSNLIYKEESSGTLELLLVRPISRIRIVSNKVVALIIIMMIIAGGSILGLIAGQQFVDFPIDLGNYSAAVLLSLCLGLVFGMLSVCITAIKPLKGLSVGLPATYLLLGFIVAGFAESVELFDILKYTSPFEYYQTVDVLLHGMRWMDLSTLAAASVALYIVSLLAFNRRDVGL